MSWYISVSTSTLRAVILVVAFVIGVVIIRSAFPENASRGIIAASPGTGTPRSPSATPSSTPSASPSSKIKLKDIVVRVLNGTQTTGLAGVVTVQLKKDGYTLRDPGNVQGASKTTVYYKKGFKAQAQTLKEKRFPDAVVAPAPSSFPSSIDITVVLGPDFEPSPSP
jgi:hypothetical protein